MPASIGVNLRVTGHCRQGDRKYMEDYFSVAYQQTEDEKDLEYAFFGIYDGHGGSEAAAYAKEHLMESIIRQQCFWSDDDASVLKAIKDGYIATHHAMWKQQANWPKTASGLPSTAGSTASVAFIRRGRIYVGHVGDSAIVLGYQKPNSPEWKARALTEDHKPESTDEIKRIEQCGGKVVLKSGVPRVVWNRPRLNHNGRILRSTPIDEIPFLAVARSLGDFWSYNSQLDKFIVSPTPDCFVIPVNTNTFRCLIFGTDGLFNMLSPEVAVNVVQEAEKHNEHAALSDDRNKIWINPSKCLVEKALKKWYLSRMRADNTSVITLLLDPPGPPRAQVLQNRKRKSFPDSGLEILTRYGEQNVEEEFQKRPCLETRAVDKHIRVDIKKNCMGASELLRKMSSTYTDERGTGDCCAVDVHGKNEIGTSTEDLFAKPSEVMASSRESLGVDPRMDCEIPTGSCTDESNVQINEVSSSSNDSYEDLHPEKQQKKSTRKNVRKSKEIFASKLRVLRTRNSLKYLTMQLRTRKREESETRKVQTRNRGTVTVVIESKSKTMRKTGAAKSVGANKSRKREGDEENIKKKKINQTKGVVQSKLRGRPRKTTTKTDLS